MNKGYGNSYVSKQDSKTRRIVYRLHHLGLYRLVAFCILSLSFAVFFSDITEGEPAMSNERPIAVVSTKGKVGASSPVGVETSNPPAKTSARSTSTAAESSAVAIPPKPAWVNTPLFVDPNNTATQYALANPSLTDIQYIARMGQVPVAQWFGDWDTNVASSVNTYVSSANASGTIPVVVLYNIPYRDCGGYSASGATSVSAYASWVQQVAAGIGSRNAVVIVEPDALAAIDCLSASDQSGRLQAIAGAVTTLKTLPHAYVYIDAGNPTWQSAGTMATRLKTADIADADGFSLNISYFSGTSQNITYGDQLSKLVDNKHYVIDTSRNGGNHNVSGSQFNPTFASLGDLPTTQTGNDRVDAYLWIKIPWESDGPVNGGPNPGEPYWSYAIQLAKNAGW